MAFPPSYTPELAERILDRIAAGESLRAICVGDGMPNRRTVLRWLESDVDGFVAKCARAREFQADALDDDMAEIECDTLSGAVDPKAANVVLSSKRWRAAKLSPKRYGERQALELSGSLDINAMSEEDIRAELAALAASGVLPDPDDCSDLV